MADTALMSGLIGLAGAAIGGLTSFANSWLTQRTQLRQKLLEGEHQRREALFAEFITEASRLFADAMSHEKDEIMDLVMLYTLLGKIKLFSSSDVIREAELTLDRIIDLYLSPNMSLREIHAMATAGKFDFLSKFSEACRRELASIG